MSKLMTNKEQSEEELREEREREEQIREEQKKEKEEAEAYYRANGYPLDERFASEQDKRDHYDSY